MTDEKNLSEQDKDQKIQALRDMITTAEQTMHSAKAMLLQLEGKKKVGRKKKVSDEEGNVVHGTFDGQIMIGTDGKQYPIPANYASKSKLVEGDMLKLNIADNGSFIYKQVGPTPRQNKIGIVGQDASGNYFVAVDGKPYKVLLASITYFDVEPGNQVAIVTSQDENAQWASIEALLQRNNDSSTTPETESLNQPALSTTPPEPKTATEILTGTTEVEPEVTIDDIIDENDNVVESDLTEEPLTEDIVEEDNDATEETIIEDDDTTTEETIVINDENITEESNTDEDSIVFDDANQSEETTSTEESNTDIVDEWVPDIDEIEKEIRAEMQQSN